MDVKSEHIFFKEDTYYYNNNTTYDDGAFLSLKPMPTALHTGKEGQGKEDRIDNTYKGNCTNSDGKRRREDGHESKSACDNLGSGSGELNDDKDMPLRKKRYPLYSPEKLQVLQSFFEAFPYPNQNQTSDLSKMLALETKQIKYWFSSKRKQVKAKRERDEISILRRENKNLKLENISIREALRNQVCTCCSGSGIIAGVSGEEHKLRIENAHPEKELDQVSALAGNLLGRPIQIELNVKGNQCEKSSKRSMYWALAVAAMDELVNMAQTDEPLWFKRSEDGGDVLNHDECLRGMNSCIGMKPRGFVSEASRETGMVIISSLALVERLMDSNRWSEMFPCLVARAITDDVISNGTQGTRDGALQLIHAELQVLSPLVPVREVKFLRYCKQHKEGVWAVVDVSIDSLCEHSAASTTIDCRRLPSGCIVQDMPNGYSMVTWVEHVEYDENVIHELYRPLIRAGMGFGAQRWVATLQRQYEYVAILNSFIVVVEGSDFHSGISITSSGRRSMLKLSQRMTNKFCEGICASKMGTWNKISAKVDKDVRVMTCKSIDDSGVPSGLVLSAATSVWFPVTPLKLFDFLRDARLMSKWNILPLDGPMQEIAHIAKGQHCGNCASLLYARAIDTNQSSIFILQETSIDAAGSLVVYAPVDMPSMNVVMNGGDSSYVALLPSGFAIVPDGLPNSKDFVPNVLNNEVDRAQKGSGSLLTIAFQILVNHHPTANLTDESVEMVNNLISCTVQKIKTALLREN